MYATKQSFGGQRASLGRAVIFKSDGVPFAGTIAAIDTDADHPNIVPIGSLNGRTVRALRFHETRSEADLDAMPTDCWTWPPRL